MLGFDNELDRIEFMIALTERANQDGSLNGQLERLHLDYLSELTGVSKTDILLDKPEEKVAVPGFTFGKGGTLKPNTYLKGECK